MAHFLTDTTFAGGLTIPDYIDHTSDSGTKFGFSADDTFVVRTGGSTRLTVADAASTFSGDVQAAGLYVGAINTSFDFYNNGTSYFNGTVEVDDSLRQTGGAASSFSGDLTVGDELTVSTISNATADPDKFLCANGSGKLGYRTGSQVRSDIGAGTSSTVGTVTQVSVGTGLDTTSGPITTSGTISLDLSELNDIDGDDPQITDFVVVSNEDESARCNLANTKIALGADKTQVLLNANFSDDSSTTSYLYVPYNSTSETTSAQYYVHWAAPGTGKFKRIIMQHVYGSMSSSFTTQLKLTKNALSTTTSAELTPSNGTTDGTYIQFDPSGSNASFVKGDRFTIAYQKSSSSKYWRGVAFSVIIELDKI